MVRGRGPVRTGVTVVVPHDGDIWTEPLFAGAHRLNGNGELTGLEWIREAGLLGGAIGLTNTHSVGVVHDALIRAEVESQPVSAVAWSLPVVGETWDGRLNDVDGFHVTADDVAGRARRGLGGPRRRGRRRRRHRDGLPRVQGRHRDGVAADRRRSRRLDVGVLVQANYGRREWLRVDGVPVGEAIPIGVVPSPSRRGADRARAADRSS